LTEVTASDQMIESTLPTKEKSSQYSSIFEMTRFSIKSLSLYQYLKDGSRPLI